MNYRFTSRVRLRGLMRASAGTFFFSFGLAGPSSRLAPPKRPRADPNPPLARFAAAFAFFRQAGISQDVSCSDGTRNR